jgi:hypothetical protein|tara:strand:+ start:4512 stop:4730 length:219 start_codon:yes stop_codon:yes gene_type:complete
MKAIKIVAVTAFAAFFTVGCAFTQKLPSVTVGGAANTDAVLAADASKEAVSLTLPLVDVNVPLPTLKTGDEE